MDSRRERWPFALERERMVARQIAARGVADPRVLAAMAAVPRHVFVPAELRAEAYQDHPLPIGLGQTISQPYIVAFMAEALALAGSERVLEVGAGTGYMAAVLGALAAEVHGIELEPVLAARARQTLQNLGIPNVSIHEGDGRGGWLGGAPYDAILLSCAIQELPPTLLAQLREGGCMIAPLGPPGGIQELVHFRKTGLHLEARPLLSVAFVPLRDP